MSKPAPALTPAGADGSGFDSAPLRGRQLLLWLVLAGLVLFTVAVARISSQSHEQYQLGRALEVRGDIPSAVLAYRHAAEAWAPFSATGPALDRLDDLARMCHGAVDTSCELMALRAMRASILSIRTVWVPHGARLPDIHARIAAGMALQVPSTMDSGEAERRYRDQLESWPSRSPDRGLALLASVMFVVWLAWFPVWLFGATPPGRPIRWGVFVAGLLVSAALAATWLLAVYHA
jgi:hypothetical protein